jgi:hypothetical protein
LAVRGAGKGSPLQISRGQAIDASGAPDNSWRSGSQEPMPDHREKSLQSYGGEGACVYVVSLSNLKTKSFYRHCDGPGCAWDMGTRAYMNMALPTSLAGRSTSLQLFPPKQSRSGPLNATRDDALPPRVNTDRPHELRILSTEHSEPVKTARSAPAVMKQIHNAVRRRQ